MTDQVYVEWQPAPAHGGSTGGNEASGVDGNAIGLSGKQPNFLQKLYDFLAIEPHPCPDVIYWASDSKQLVIAQPDRLVKEVLPKLFKHDKMSSFGRQLNIYGFSRLFPGRQFKDANGNLSDASVWAHPTLHRLSNQQDLTAIKRRAAPKLFRTRRLANGQVVRTRAGPAVEAKFREVRESIAESRRARSQGIYPGKGTMGGQSMSMSMGVGDDAEWDRRGSWESVGSNGTAGYGMADDECPSSSFLFMNGSGNASADGIPPADQRFGGFPISHSHSPNINHQGLQVQTHRPTLDNIHEGVEFASHWDHKSQSYQEQNYPVQGEFSHTPSHPQGQQRRMSQEAIPASESFRMPTHSQFVPGVHTQKSSAEIHFQDPFSTSKAHEGNPQPQSRYLYQVSQSPSTASATPLQSPIGTQSTYQSVANAFGRPALTPLEIRAFQSCPASIHASPVLRPAFSPTTVPIPMSTGRVPLPNSNSANSASSSESHRAAMYGGFSNSNFQRSGQYTPQQSPGVNTPSHQYQSQHQQPPQLGSLGVRQTGSYPPFSPIGNSPFSSDHAGMGNNNHPYLHAQTASQLSPPGGVNTSGLRIAQPAAPNPFASPHDRANHLVSPISPDSRPPNSLMTGNALPTSSLASSFSNAQSSWSNQFPATPVLQSDRAALPTLVTSQSANTAREMDMEIEQDTMHSEQYHKDPQNSQGNQTKQQQQQHQLRAVVSHNDSRAQLSIQTRFPPWQNGNGKGTIDPRWVSPQGSLWSTPIPTPDRRMSPVSPDAQIILPVDMGKGASYSDVRGVQEVAIEEAMVPPGDGGDAKTDGDYTAPKLLPPPFGYPSGLSLPTLSTIHSGVLDTGVSSDTQEQGQGGEQGQAETLQGGVAR